LRRSDRSEPDTLFDAGHRLALEDALSKAQSVLMEGFGHNPHWEDSEKVSAVLRDFFRGHFCLQSFFAGNARLEQ
jgi:pimeloyl-ACP methyl ester carboxylesterase